VVEHDDGTHVMYNFSRRKYRPEGAGDAAVPPTVATSTDGTASKRAKRGDAADGSAASSSSSDDDAMPAPKPGAHAAMATASGAKPSGIMSASGAPEVDPESGLVGQGKVYQDSDDVIYEARLTEVRLGLTF
jgi:hypothetical protein